MTIIGTGQHAGVVEEILKPHGIPIVKKNCKPGQEITITMNVIIAIGDNRDREAVAKHLDMVPFCSAVSKDAHIADDAEIGEGTVICRGACINNNVRIGRHVIINTNASVDHDCVIGDFAHIAPGATLCGGVHIMKGAFIGANATVTPGVTVGAWREVKAGEVVK